VLTVCAQCRCTKCSIDMKSLPEDCEYGLKHILNVDDYGNVFTKLRRSGKTTKIIELAFLLSDAGHSVAILTPNYAATKRMESLIDKNNRIIVINSYNKKRLRQNLAFRNFLVLSDELDDWVIDCVNELGSIFVVGYRS
jgi:hypothetical protein